MSGQAPVESRTVGRKAKPSDTSKTPRDRLDIRIDPALRQRAEKQADRFGIDLSAYIRLALTRNVEQDEASDPETDDKPKKKP